MDKSSILDHPFFGKLILGYMSIGAIITSISMIAQLTYYSYGPHGLFGDGTFIGSVINTVFGMFTSVIRGLLWPIMSWPVWTGEVAIHHWLLFPWFESALI